MKFKNPFRIFYFWPAFVFVMVILIIVMLIFFTAVMLFAEEDKDIRFLREEQRYAEAHPGYVSVKAWELYYLKKGLPEEKI